MTNAGEVTKKKPGNGIMVTGLVLAVIGALFLIAIISGGGSPTVAVWAVPLIGAVLAVVGFAMRILAAVESR